MFDNLLKNVEYLGLEIHGARLKYLRMAKNGQNIWEMPKYVENDVDLKYVGK